MAALIYLLIAGAIMHAVRGFGPSFVTPGAGAALSLGYVLLSAYFAGELAKRVKLPRLTGYLLCGLVAGPHGLGFLLQPDLDDLHIFTSVAVALIALGAGVELSFKEMRPLARSILLVSTGGILCTAVLLSGALLLLRPWLSFFDDLPMPAALATAAVVAVVLTAQSPAVALALRTELKAEGIVSNTVLGLVVVGDVATIVLFSIAATYATAMLGGSADVAAVGLRLAGELLGSILAGTALGLLLIGFLRTGSPGVPLFVLALCVVIGEVSTTLHLEPVLVGLAAGATVRNVSGHANALDDAIRRTQLPVYVVFFGVAGAGIHLDALLAAALPACALVVTRALGLLSGARLGARIAGAPEAVRRFAGFGMLPQAGLAIALAMSFKRALPQLGDTAAALVLGVVAINEIIAPALYRWALLRAGEGSDEAGASDESARPSGALPLPSVAE
jgi:Kef-type K+ transport system membrane component KefB